MVFMSRWRRVRATEEDEDDEEKKTQRRSGSTEESTTRRPDYIKLYLSVALLTLVTGFVLICSSQILKVSIFPWKSSALQMLGSRALHVQEEQPAARRQNVVESHKKTRIKDVVIFPEEILVLINLGRFSSFTSKERLTCIFGSRSSTKVIAVERGFRKATVRCEMPPEGLDELYGGVALDQADGAESVLLEMHNLPDKFIYWNQLVFDILTTPTDVVLFAKGIIKKQGQVLKIKEMRCVFDNFTETDVLIAAQEVFRCRHPPRSTQHKFIGKKVTLKVNGTIFPSVAYYEPNSREDADHDRALMTRSSPSRTPEKKHFLCACTMIFNGAKFLKEWVVYHAHLGVERFFLYDNNSEDDLEAEAQSLSSHNVTRHPWPWLKTQEAGFSYCAQQAQEECDWMMFTDVDEFIFPQFWIPRLSNQVDSTTQDAVPTTTSLPILATLINETIHSQELNSTLSAGKKVGQIRFNCLDFGPSGQKKHPKEGVLQGYTCRMTKYQRHKSIVFLPALSKSLLNVVHHFSLKPSYGSVLLPPEKGVINHYKYQAWEEFKVKFRRRVSAFVTDWKESKNLMSKDRTPGLGNQDTEPPDWEHQFCEVNDTALRDYTHGTLGPVSSWQ